MIVDINFSELIKNISVWVFAFLKLIVFTLGWKGFLLLGAIIILISVILNKRQRRTDRTMEKMREYIIIQAEREISIQILFALTAYENITKKGEGNHLVTFSSIHSFLTHCANISKILWSPKKSKWDNMRKTLGQNFANIISIPHLPNLKNKKFRDSLDHYDERILGWVKEEFPKHESGAFSRGAVSDLIIGNTNNLVSQNMLFLRHYNPGTKDYSFRGETVNLEKLKEELLCLQAHLRGPIKYNSLADM